MRAPKRTAWATQSELGELYEMIFGPMADISLRRRGLARMSIYISSPSCPAFLHLLYDLITADLFPHPTDSPEEIYSSRMACALAVIRFVNGMVDPLQIGPYARPISHLAATLGIPPSLIALRHRATHEDLPPLPLLRQAVHGAIEYIHRHSFLPLLATTPDPQRRAGAGRNEDLVRRWKSAMKARVRNKVVGDENLNGRELRGLKTEFEAEELENIVDALCGVGGLVPVARKKRQSPTSTTPSSISLQIWTPLLLNLAASRPAFPTILADAILTRLIQPMINLPNVSGDSSQSQERPNQDPTFRWSLAVWLLWLWRGDEDTFIIEQKEKKRLWRRLLGSLLLGDEVLRRLHTILSDVTPFEKRLSPVVDSRFLGLVDGEDILSIEEGEVDPGNQDVDQKLMVMERRLLEFEAKVPQQKISRVDENDVLDSAGPEGWRRLTANQWRACPIGCWGSL
ncbi:MAG: rRNA-processing protein las1 [Tremellales sp. Tagirdzhanova-0007]|nr:MAG: rRNA-processing protein las1 [Tremellales sp. Tagirdzhanova-0007]